MSTNSTAIEVSDLCFGYGSRPVLDRIGLRVAEGSIYGFLGPNGAGKTTLIRLLLGLLTPSSGRIRVNGEAPVPGRGPAGVGAMIETPSLYGNLSARENLAITELTLGIRHPDVGGLLDSVGLGHARRQRVSTFSLGMKQRLSIALALLARPRLLILDEPVNGLDPEGIDEVRQLLTRLSREQGMTIFLSSHILSDVERVATHIGILRSGRLVFDGALSETRTGRLEILCDDVTLAGAVLGRMGLVHAMTGEGRISVDGEPDSADVNRRLVQAGIGVRGLAAHRNSLEDFYHDAS